MDKETKNYFRTGKTPESWGTESYMLPESAQIKTPGIRGILFRAIHNKRGWTRVNFMEQLLDRAEKQGWKRLFPKQ